MSTSLRSKCRFLRIPLFAGFLLIAASLILAPAAEARSARKAATAQSAASGRLLNVRSAVLMDARTGKILYSQNPDARIPPASLTKVMSMMVTFDAIRSGKVKLSDSIRVSRHAARQGGSRMGLRAGERVSLKRLLMGMAVSSGNDASMAVAERVGGSGRAFVKMMNRKARQIGMSSSTFKTPNGLPAAGQYTTARDMARLGYVYLKNNPSALQYHRVRVLKHRGRSQGTKTRCLGPAPAPTASKPAGSRLPATTSFPPCGAAIPASSRSSSAPNPPGYAAKKSAGLWRPVSNPAPKASPWPPPSPNTSHPARPQRRPSKSRRSAATRPPRRPPAGRGGAEYPGKGCAVENG